MRLAWQCRHGEDFKTGCEQCVMSPQTRSERMLESMAAMIRLAVLTLLETAHLPGQPEQVRDALTKQVEHVQVSIRLVTACGSGLGVHWCPVEFPLRRVASTLSSHLLEASSAVMQARRDLVSVRRSADAWCSRMGVWANREIGDDDG